MMMPLSMLLLLCLVAAYPLPLQVHANIPPARGYSINCGATEEEATGGITWTPDSRFIGVGNASQIDVPNISPVLSTLRYFPDKSAQKYCYAFPVAKEGKYLVRTVYYYGGFDGGKEPPVFDQIFEGTKWSTVNTTENYASGLASYYEIIIMAKGKTLSVCLARNSDTVSSPFISALELRRLEDSMYKSTDLDKYALSTVARHSFGFEGDILSYPDDPFNRYWEPFKDMNQAVESSSNVSSSDFWNLPPEKVFQTALTTGQAEKKLTVNWPAQPLPGANYYIALYFQDNRAPGPNDWRVFDVSVNKKDFYKGLNVSTAGVMVYGNQWPLSGQTEITLEANENSTVGPLINAGEVLQIVPLGGKTLTRDVIAMEDLARSIQNPPSDWSGDPCLPSSHSWTGVTCSQDDAARVVKLNLTNHGLVGSLPNSIAKLTAISDIWLGGNKLSGPIPDVSTLTNLVTLRLENNQFTGSIPSSLGELPKLQQLFLQQNMLSGQIPVSLKSRIGTNIQLVPGNKFE